jgi:hypothetical protein
MVENNGMHAQREYLIKFSGNVNSIFGNIFYLALCNFYYGHKLKASKKLAFFAHE